MSKLACNIVSYRPDPDMLAANFSPWHVEALLQEAAALIDRCLDDYREYSSLDYAWNVFKYDLEMLEKQVGPDKKPELEKKVGFDETGETRTSSGWVYYHADDSEEGTDRTKAGGETEPEEGERRAEPATPDLRAEAVSRKRELSARGQPFALDEQRDLVLKRLCRDYEEAVNRATVAEEGLKRIYGHAGVPSPLPSEAETLGSSITNLAIWTRNATEWVAKYRQMEQSFTRLVSVRALMSRNAWGQLRHARDSFSVKLQVPAELFQGYDNCRLRGISVSLVGEAGTVPWSAMVRLPEAAVYVRSGQSVEADQSRLAPCLLGRVENRRGVRTSEICGEASHLNASPVGRSNTAEGLWSLEILKPVGAVSESFAQVDDVVLEIKTVGTVQKTGS